MALFPNLGYGDQPPISVPRAPLPILPDDAPDKGGQPEKGKQPKGPPSIYGGASPMVTALQGRPDPAMTGLFGTPAPQLQHMAGDVVRPPLEMFIPPMYANQHGIGQFYDKVMGPQSGGYQLSNPNAVSQGVLSGKIHILTPQGR